MASKLTGPAAARKRWRDAKNISVEVVDAALLRAERRVVAAAMRLTRLGAEEADFWPKYFALERACAGLLDRYGRR